MPGITLMHEHLRLDLSKEKGDPDCLLDQYDLVCGELAALARRGLARVVDLSCRGMGRDYAYLDAMAADTGLEIVISTGYYKEPFLPASVHTSDERSLAALFIADIREGCEGSGRKAALIGEIGSSLNVMTEVEQKVFRSAARAHLETGVPISTHTTLGTLGLEQTLLLKSLGVDAGRLVIGHLDLARDPQLLFRVLDEGAYVEFDTIGKTRYLADATRAEYIAACCARGYSRQLLLSLDLTRRSHLKANGGHGYAYLQDVFLPRLRASGVKDSEIEDMLVHNPHQLLGH